MSSQQGLKLLDEVKKVMRLKHYALQTERIYCDWIKRYIKFHKMRDRSALSNGEDKIESFLTHLAMDANVAASTQNQAMNALVFLYKHVLQDPLEKRIDAVRSTKNRRIPVVLTQEEVKQIMMLIDGAPSLVVKLLYGSGLRITEAVRLRVQDIDFDYKQITVRSGKGNKDRVTTFPVSLEQPLKTHLQKIEMIHQQDLKEGFGTVYLPHALARKYPSAAKEWNWQFVYPARTLAVDPRSKIRRRHHLDQSAVNKAIKTTVRKLGITKKVSAHTFRHSFATHLLQRGTDIRTIQALLGHNDLETTLIYTHVLNQGGQGVSSPLDDLGIG